MIVSYEPNTSPKLGLPILTLISYSSIINNYPITNNCTTSQVYFLQKNTSYLMVDILDLINYSHQHSKSKRLAVCYPFPIMRNSSPYQLSSSAEPGLSIPNMSPS